ncbi:type II secretion system minor pseudopilin GspJ [Yersinia enterocolitica]|uniref:type II secretion system minor pseudopilin GspJ n=1 Tax=Yersinia enterocolitica TaxID=630 RepID=UPI0030A37017|nr:type II secretion system minor pseudopilin GspJ [Yersinia enterocolitica]EKN6081433.1 type II secretion system protein GspJ [Yersinia enterocolitica]EKN6153993.1 type II secretion system protein GspJ [Yersinia enterocolitica]EKN6173516.1 type II secretion system protein GspJ [Yersinia enterocolitica]
MMQDEKKTQQGFTLLEMLLGLTIFSMLSIGAYGVFQGMLANHDVTQSRMTRLTKLIRTIDKMNGDFSQAVPRVGRMAGVMEAQVFQVGTTLLQSDDASVIFIRAGLLNPDARLRRSELQRVGYRLSRGQLERISWGYPDVVPGTQPTVTPLLEGVKRFRLRFYYYNQWVTDWQVTKELPQAVEVTLDLEDYGQIQRRFLLASTLENSG